MTQITLGTLAGIIFLFGLFFGLMLIAYDDGVPFGVYRKVKCKLGVHTHKVGFRKRTNKYYCQSCKAPRSHPALKSIKGGE